MTVISAILFDTLLAALFICCSQTHICHSFFTVCGKRPEQFPEFFDIVDVKLPWLKKPYENLVLKANILNSTLGWERSFFIKNITWTQGNLFVQSRGQETLWSLNSPISWEEPAVSGATPLMVCLSPDHKHIHVLMTSQFFNFLNLDYYGLTLPCCHMWHCHQVW